MKKGKYLNSIALSLAIAILLPVLSSCGKAPSNIQTGAPGKQQAVEGCPLTGVTAFYRATQSIHSRLAYLRNRSTGYFYFEGDDENDRRRTEHRAL